MGFLLTGDGTTIEVELPQQPSGAGQFPGAGTTLSGPPLNPPSVSPTPSIGQGVALSPTQSLPPTVAITAIQGLTADPVNPAFNQVWVRTDTNALCINIGGSIKRVTLS